MFKARASRFAAPSKLIDRHVGDDEADVIGQGVGDGEVAGELGEIKERHSMNRA